MAIFVRIPHCSDNFLCVLCINVYRMNYQMNYEKQSRSRYHGRENDHRSRSFRSEQYSNSDKFDRLEMHIDTEKVGKLIGRGGSNIQELQDKTGTRIHVS